MPSVFSATIVLSRVAVQFASTNNPPPGAPTLTLLSTMVLLTIVSGRDRSVTSMPPPAALAELSAMVLLAIVSSPSLTKMPPPPRSLELPAMVQPDADTLPE